MGANLSDLLDDDAFETMPITELPGNGDYIAADAMNLWYQSYYGIRAYGSGGEPLSDSKGRITSHLIGMTNRIPTLLEAGYIPIYVLDGTPPDAKADELQRREQRRADNDESGITDDMKDHAKELLDAAGIPYVQAPGEAEKYAARLERDGSTGVDYVLTQDHDVTVYGVFGWIKELDGDTVTVKTPSRLLWNNNKLSTAYLNDETRRKRAAVALMLGTDYNDGAHGVGPARAGHILDAIIDASEGEVLDTVYEEAIQYDGSIDKNQWAEIMDIYTERMDIHHDLDDLDAEPDIEAVRSVLSDADFSDDNIESFVNAIQNLHPNA